MPIGLSGNHGYAYGQELADRYAVKILPTEGQRDSRLWELSQCLRVEKLRVPGDFVISSADEGTQMLSDP
jgi:hypothetical protein